MKGDIMDCCIRGKKIEKKYKRFALDIKELNIPSGYATALIGENGAGKTTLLNILSGIRIDFRGSLLFFEQYNEKDRDNEKCPVREKIGYTGNGVYFLPNWTIRQVAEVSSMLFSGFDRKKFEDLVRYMRIDPMNGLTQRVSSLSDGNRMKLEIAAVLARDTDMLIMDEPSAALDPLARDDLNKTLRRYIEEKEPHRSILFSTHNIADMEAVTDYAIIMELGKIVEEGWVDRLKEKYVYVVGEKDTAQAALPYMITLEQGNYNFSGVAFSDRKAWLSKLPVRLSRPSLSEIVIAVMKNATLAPRLGLVPE
ncbi:MAG: ABC transporter ATP-binding protein [Lachnospiraceae bacterium]|nr:ABC transporter ATP-binding protein [Lachnospiraceae bacterium]